MCIDRGIFVKLNLYKFIYRRVFKRFISKYNIVFIDKNKKVFWNLGNIFNNFSLYVF